MSLKSRLSVDLGEIVKKKQEQRSAGQVVEAPKTAIGMHVDSIYHDKKLSEENESLRSKLDAFDGAQAAKRLDPRCINVSRWANRDEGSFHTKEFQGLKEEIEEAGGNVQPIKVRPVVGVPGTYEIVFGHRRHRACLELGINVLSLIEELDDASLFTQMDRENRQRADLRPYEQGVMYAKALDEGLFPSQRKLAESLGVDVSGAGRLIALARLPSDVLNAFKSPLEIQFDWGPTLNAAIQKDPDIVLIRARELSNLSIKKSAKAVFDTLTGGVESLHTQSKKPTVVSGRTGSRAKIVFDPKKKLFDVRIEGVDSNRASELEQLVKKFLEK